MRFAAGPRVPSSASLPALAVSDRRYTYSIPSLDFLYCIYFIRSSYCVALIAQRHGLCIFLLFFMPAYYAYAQSALGFSRSRDSISEGARQTFRLFLHSLSLSRTLAEHQRSTCSRFTAASRTVPYAHIFSVYVRCVRVKSSISRKFESRTMEVDVFPTNFELRQGFLR